MLQIVRQVHSPSVRRRIKGTHATGVRGTGTALTHMHDTRESSDSLVAFIVFIFPTPLDLSGRCAQVEHTQQLAATTCYCVNARMASSLNCSKSSKRKM